MPQMNAMNDLNRILHNKPVKLFYFIRNFARYAVPHALLQRRLGEVLSEIDRRDDREEILRRAAYYNRLSEGSVLPPSEAHRLGDHCFGRGVRTAYFFDSYEFTRWFDDDLLWNMIPGDVTHIPSVPSIVKSRPIAGNNANSVLLNLDKFRHFVFLKDAVPFREKENRAIFRCAINCHHPNHHLRRRFMERYYGSTCCDAGISNRHPSLPPEWTVPHISMYDHLRYRYILAIEGNDVATNLKWVMSTNSLAVMPRPTYETWFMEGTLRPNYHYVEIRPDYADLEERMHYYDTHPEEAEAIIAHAHAYIDRFRDARREKLISLLVLRRYFECTGQL
ncbi:glycosyl transferase family 90 [Alistipes sp.]|uniref:glycosyl transferase family 90 n=1 Tax=Alistipes sp. TaxID=1872444 RepID=UPI0025BD227F|nr:glycosyl transferase family 90 [Alistipes sp.]MCI7140983.1 lipopolysaccharide biosynthesis protein [Alistipes sp.]MDY5395929.1 glycosyl transferase family 90 [Alistipes sp.]